MLAIMVMITQQECLLFKTILASDRQGDVDDINDEL